MTLPLALASLGVGCHDKRSFGGACQMSSSDSGRPGTVGAPSANSIGRKSYTRPTLVKGPVLASITAQLPPTVLSLPCWVARAAFGESDIRWMIFRAWLLEDAPAWFRAKYLRHGAAVGGWLANHPHARAVVRAAMMPAIRRKISL